jgi:hypothetical protein
MRGDPSSFFTQVKPAQKRNEKQEHVPPFSLAYDDARQSVEYSSKNSADQKIAKMFHFRLLLSHDQGQKYLFARQPQSI